MSATQPNASACLLRNGDAVPLAAVPTVAAEKCADEVAARCANGSRLAGLLAWPTDDDSRELIALVMHDASGQIELLRTFVAAGASYPSITPQVPAAHVFERLLFEEERLTPQGHPWLKPVRRHRALEEPMTATRPTTTLPPAHPFFQVSGPGTHEVAVGPVHAGVIEPGHFRFQCSGEIVHHLEIQLGYQHRGVTTLLERGTPAQRLVAAESIAGDTAIGHALAHCMVVEALTGTSVPLAAQMVRGIALELERLANHVGDLGALCNDVAYQPGATWFGRLRGEFLNLLLEISGNRFGRGLLVPGGVRCGIDAAQRASFALRLQRAARDLHDTATLTFDAPSVLSRFERTGAVSHAVAEQLGLTGPVARASGCNRDARRDHAHGVYRFSHLPVATTHSGDVMGRALVRWLEVERSFTFVREQLAQLPDGPWCGSSGAVRPDQIAVALVEAWRGTIVHVGRSDPQAAIAGYRVFDPSLQNWTGLAMAMRNGQISDFPLCNKSFNLSYAGHDL